jgi:purine-binding chemotaxis protein CheW
METTQEETVTGGEVLQLVTFTLGNEEYAVNILSVQEINRITEITQVPNSPDHVEGVINLRGKVIPVVNLRKKFNFEDKPTDDTSRIIIMEIQGITNGLIVDSVSEVLRIPASSVEPAPPMSAELQNQFIKGIAKLENRLIILIDLDNLLGDAAGIDI